MPILTRKRRQPAAVGTPLAGGRVAGMRRGVNSRAGGNPSNPPFCERGGFLGAYANAGTSVIISLPHRHSGLAPTVIPAYPTVILAYPRRHSRESGNPHPGHLKRRG